MLRPTLGTGSVLQEMGWQHRDGTSSHCRWGRSAQPSGEGTEPESLCPKRERWDEEEEEEEHGEMRSRRVGPDVISTPSSWLVCSLVPEAPAAGSDR